MSLDIIETLAYLFLLFLFIKESILGIRDIIVNTHEYGPVITFSLKRCRVLVHAASHKKALKIVSTTNFLFGARNKELE